MKYNLILLLIVFMSCKTKEDWEKRSEGLYNYDYTIAVDKYLPIWNKFNDSLVCAYRCKDNNGAKRLFDSSTKYYTLMYPNGNPSDRRMEREDNERRKQEHYNCNCQ